jgi:TP901 family phage tail tape measure protein
MPEEITQKLGFDASKAIQELVRLRQELQNFKQSLQNVSGGFRQFASSATPAVIALKELGKAANLTTISLVGLTAVTGGRAADIAGPMTRAAAAMQGLSTQAKTTGRAVTTAASATAEGAAKTGEALKKAGKAGAEAGSQISISWKTIARVVQAQVIVRAVSAIVSSFREAHDAARDFSVSIAEIDTLAEGALGPTRQMSDAVRDLSQSLGSDAADVAAGVYQTLSNQVVTTGESLEFTAAAGKLAIATQSELGLAVDALSSIMNSYNLEASEAERVSDVLFRTVDLGRLRLEEFGAVLGRVSPLTAALGISYLEMSAAIAALTQKGVPAHTAITQLTQVTQKLLRPTDKLLALYEEWGVETGAEAIERFGGLQGVLLKMKDATAGNDTAFADLLGRVRAIVGALNLTSNEANALDDAMRQMSEGVDVTSDAFDRIRESSGRKSIEAWNNLKTSMLDVGDALLEITTPVAKVLRLIVDNMKEVVTSAAAAGIGFLALRTSAAAGAAQMGFLAVSIKGVTAALATLGPIAALALAAFLAVKIGEVWADWANTAEESAERIDNANRAMTDRHTRESQTRVETTRQEYANQTKFAGTFFTEMSQLYLKDVGEFERRTETVGKVLEGTLDRLLKKRAEAVKIVRDAVLEADEAIKSSAEKQATAQQQLDDLTFKQRLRRIGARRAAEAIHQRAQLAASQASRAFAAAGADEEAQAGARKRAQLALTRADEDASHQKTLGNLKGIQNAEKVRGNILKTIIAGEKSFQAARTQLRDTAHRAELQRLEETGVAVELIITKLKELADPAGKTFAQMTADTERIAELIPEFSRNLQGAFDFDAFESLGLPEGINQLKAGVVEAFQGASINWAGAVNEFNRELTSRKYEVPIKIVITNEGFIAERVKKFGETDVLGSPGKLASQNLKVAQEIAKAYEDAERSANQSLESIQAKAATVRTIPAAKSLLNVGFFGSDQKGDETLAQFQRRVNDGEQIIERFRQKMISFGDTLEEQALKGGGVTDEIRTGIEDIRQEAIKLGKEHFISPDGAGHIKNMFKELVAARAEFEDFSKAMETQKGIPVGSYEEATKLLDNLGGEARRQVLTEEVLGVRKAETNEVLQRSIEAQNQLNQSSNQGVQAINDEVTAVQALKTAYAEAAVAANERWEITRQPDVAGRPGLEGETNGVDAGGLSLQAEAARQLQVELQAVGAEFATILNSSNGLATSVGSSLQPATQLREVFAGLAQATIDIGASVPLMTGQLAAASSVADALTASLNKSATAARGVTDATRSIARSIASAASAGNSMAASMNAAAAAAVKAAQACAKAAQQCSGGGIRASNGGRFFANGGRGTDTVSAMLTPGEFVVNAKSARSFFPQLQAINAGQAPVFREQGGHVTNIGDVNVTLQGGDGPASQTIREIGNGLRRELKRKTVRLY